MTTFQTFSLFIGPLGAAIIGLVVYYQAMNDVPPSKRDVSKD